MAACGLAKKDSENGFAPILVLKKGNTSLIEGKCYLVDLHVLKVIDAKHLLDFTIIKYLGYWKIFKVILIFFLTRSHQILFQTKLPH